MGADLRVRQQRQGVVQHTDDCPVADVWKSWVGLGTSFSGLEIKVGAHLSVHLRRKGVVGRHAEEGVALSRAAL